ncbi:pentapeptide repeat-containing protein [Micromonospora sp. DT43]|uniref:pentapeptide repeat-containing protein n=1 Tax=Micromonospora sp. DT43 TaxID=3393440 RepID=UPI003CF6BA4D
MAVRAATTSLGPRALWKRSLKTNRAGKRIRDWRSYEPLRPITLVVGTVVLLLLVLMAAAWMWRTALEGDGLTSGSLSVVEQADITLRRTQIKLDAIRNALGVAAAMGAVVALLLALRRQYVRERLDRDDLYLKQRTADYVEVDATEKRITELYVKAAEQLGSEKAPIRMAGVYALERLADDTPSQRQTIVDLLCAYLRMPFNPSDLEFDPAVGEIESEGHRVRLDAALREREVRLTVQSVLRRHLHRAELSDSSPASVAGIPSRGPTLNGSFRKWDHVALNLAGASLLDLDFSGVEFDRAVFDGAIFYGRSIFSSSRWEQATFVGATFAGLADFRDVQASLLAMSESAFVEEVRFERAHFGVIDATGVVFQAGAAFNYVNFEKSSSFASSLFLGGADFDAASFGALVFEGSRFIQRAGFTRCYFNDAVNFRRAIFGASVEFEGSVVTRAFLNRHVLPVGWSMGHYVGAESRAVVEFVGLESEPADDYPPVIKVPSSEVDCCVRGGGIYRRGAKAG